MVAEKKSYGYVWFVVLLGAMGGLLFGIDQANWGIIETRENFVDYFCSNETDSIGKWGSTDACMSSDNLPSEMADLQTYGNSLIAFGSAFSAFFIAPFIVRNFGRRAGLFSGALGFIIFCLIAILIKNLWVFYVARLLTGCAVGIVTYTLPMWQCEIAPIEMRGAMGTTIQLCCVFGGLIASTVGLINGLNWKTPLLLIMSLITIFLIVECLLFSTAISTGLFISRLT